MKKTVFFLVFWGISALCCFAEESIEALPLFSYSGGLPAQPFMFGFSAVHPVLGADSLAWKQAGFDITKYNDDYGLEPSLTHGLSLLLAGAGFFGFLAGTVLAANHDIDFGAGLGLSLGGAAVCAIGITWFILSL